VSHLGGYMLSSGRSPFDNLPHIGHFIVSEAVVASIIEAERADVPSCTLLIVVRVCVGHVVSLIAKTLSEATRSPGQTALSCHGDGGWSTTINVTLLSQGNG
jgi:hypothetical protein